MTLGTGLTRDRSMSSVRDWTAGSIVGALILVSPVVAFLVIIAAETLIDALMEAGMAADCALAAGSTGWVLFRRILSHPEEAPDREPEQEFDEAAIAVPPM